VQSLSPGYQRVADSIQQGVHYTIYALGVPAPSPAATPTQR
jgi:hypothetical protein